MGTDWKEGRARYKKAQRTDPENTKPIVHKRKNRKTHPFAVYSGIKWYKDKPPNFHIATRFKKWTEAEAYVKSMDAKQMREAWWTRVVHYIIADETYEKVNPFELWELQELAKEVEHA